MAFDLKRRYRRSLTGMQTGINSCFADGNLVDTANLYTNGSSESFLGEFKTGDCECVVTATKYTNATAGILQPMEMTNRSTRSSWSLEHS
jgi:aryl-alcohol dehydrogenase-like predicted oxidoreductase